MIQFLKVACLDPIGDALINVKDISAVLPGPIESASSVIVTKHGNYAVYGNSEHFISLFGSLFGGEWDGIPAPDPIEGST